MMDNKDVTLLNMTVRSIHHDPNRLEQYLKLAYDHSSAELKKALDVLNILLAKMGKRRDGTPDLSVTNILRVASSATNQTEVEKHVIAALRSASTSVHGG